MTTATPETKLTMKDFSSDQDVRWCPGCGDYSILSAVRKVLAGRSKQPHEYAFISGIGCSSRFPYYMETYGMHSIHGRALTVATGFKVARPDIETWVITGDGDALSIGGNHTMHALRRNVNVKILLFNNQIYGLTKGQYSPTSPIGQKTKSTPVGSLDYPVLPLTIALASEATFVARSVDMHQKHLIATLERAADHEGSAFVEIYQNCNIFNDGALAHAQDRNVRSDNVIELEHGKPMIFGKNNEKGLQLRDGQLRVVTIGQDGITEGDLLVHDEQAPSWLHYMLARMKYPEMPEVIGVLRQVERPLYDELVNQQVEEVIERKGPGDLQKLLTGRATWTVGV